jgi:hypothetical protein
LVEDCGADPMVDDLARDADFLGLLQSKESVVTAADRRERGVDLRRMQVFALRRTGEDVSTQG